METARVEPTDLILLDGEQIAAELETGSDNGNLWSGRHEALILTDSRIIHASTGGRRRGAVIAAVRDIDSVEVTTVRPGIGAYFWAALAVVLEPGAVSEHRPRNLANCCAVRRVGDGSLPRRKPSAGLRGTDRGLQNGWVRDQVAVRR